MRSNTSTHLIYNLTVFQHFPSISQRRLYKEDVDDAFKPHLIWLTKIHMQYSKNDTRYTIKQLDMKRPRLKQPYLLLEEWIAIADYYELIKPDPHFSYQEASFCFFWSKMRVSDEIRRRIEWTSITFMDFVEALARVGEESLSLFKLFWSIMHYAELNHVYI